MSVHTVRRRTCPPSRRKKMLLQRVLGLGLIAMCALILWVASTGKSVEDRDATAVLLLAPIGFYLLFTKNTAIH